MSNNLDKPVHKILEDYDLLEVESYTHTLLIPSKFLIHIRLMSFKIEIH